MVHEDDDDKIRRNLVVMSVAILLVAFLDVPVQQVLAKAFADNWKPSLARGWVAAFAVLFYFALRYRFDPKGEAAFKNLANTYAVSLMSGANRLLKQQMDERFQWWELLDAEARKKSSNSRKIISISYPGRPDVPVDSGERRRESDMQAGLPRIKSIQWRSIAVIFTWTSAGLVGFPDYSIEASVPVSRLNSARLRIYSAYHSWVYSSEATTFLAPVLLAMAAAAVAAFKFTTHWITS